MFGFLGLVATVAITAFGYIQTRAFVRRRLTYVDAIHAPAAPVLAGFGAWLVALPVVALMPLIGGLTALLFGVAVGAGVLSGVKDIRRRLPAG